MTQVGRCLLALLALVFAAPIAPAGAAESDLRAQLVPKRFTTLSAEQPAKIQRISVKEGDRFAEGQVLVALDCMIQKAQLDEARAAYQAADKTRQVNQRLVELNSGGVLEADVSAAKAAEALAKVALAQAVMSKCVISAPFPGRLVEQKVREHQYVQAGQALLEILDDETLEVEFIAPSSWLAWLKGGQGFQVQVDETAKAYPAKIVRIGAKADAVSHSVKVVGEVGGHFPDLTAGMSGRILITPPR